MALVCLYRFLSADMAKTTKQQIRVLMADDHAIFREGLRKLLDGDDEITIVGEASNGNDCIKMLAKLKPDILLLDLRMPDKDGLAVLEEVNFDQLPTRVVEKIIGHVDSLAPSTRSSLLMDLQQGKPIEVEALLGAVVRRSAESRPSSK